MPSSTLSGHAACLHSLISSGCDIALPDHYGDTPTRVAQRYGHQNCSDMINEHLIQQKQDCSK